MNDSSSNSNREQCHIIPHSSFVFNSILLHVKKLFSVKIGIGYEKHVCERDKIDRGCFSDEVNKEKNDHDEDTNNPIVVCVHRKQ